MGVLGQVKCPQPDNNFTDNLVDYLFKRSKKLTPEKKKSAPIDLVGQVQKRGFEPVGMYEELLGNDELWDEDVKLRLVAVVEACESVGIPYRIKYTNSKDQGYPASIKRVTIKIVAPDN